jgi:hypothetical protein
MGEAWARERLAQLREAKDRIFCRAVWLRYSSRRPQ